MSFEGDSVSKKPKRDRRYLRELVEKQIHVLNPLFRSGIRIISIKVLCGLVRVDGHCMHQPIAPVEHPLKSL